MTKRNRNCSGNPAHRCGSALRRRTLLAAAVAVMLVMNGLTAASAEETPEKLRNYPGYENSKFKNLNFPDTTIMDPKTIGVNGGETSLDRNQFDTNLLYYERDFASLGKSGNTYGVLELFPGAHLKVTGRLINQGLVWLQSGSVLEVGSYISDKGEMGLVFLDGADKGTSLIVNGDFEETPESSMTHHFVVLGDGAGNGLRKSGRAFGSEHFS